MQAGGVFAPSAALPGRPFTTRKLDSVAVRAALDTRLSILRCAPHPPLSKGKKDLVLRYRGLAPSAGNSLARRRQKSEIGVASATAPSGTSFHDASELEPVP